MKIFAWILVPFAFLAVFASTAFAQGASTDDGSILEIARPVLDALLTGRPGLAAALGLVLLAAIGRRYGGRRFAFLNTDAGGALLVLVASFGGAAAAAIGGGAVWSLGLAWSAAKMAAASAGGYSLVKRLIVAPMLRPLRAKAPAWLRPVFDLVLWIFEKPDPVAEAVAAGDAAVKASPGAGAAGVIGKPRDMP
jgi:hypothetical protein